MTQVRQETARIADQWLERINQFLSSVSKLTSTVNARGNSKILKAKLNHARKAVKGETKIGRGLKALGELKGYDLAYNSELKQVLKDRKLKGARSKRYQHFSKDAKALLGKYPSELESFLGEVERLEEGGLDAYRQCLSSCRNCIENLSKRVSGENGWRDGMRKLVSSKTQRKLINDTYQFLSAYGVHGKEVPNESEAEVGLSQTISAVRLLLKED